MFSILLVVQILLAIGIISLILLQQGKGADMGAAFGSGASGTVFGARGSGSFLTRTTGVLALLFFANSLLLASPLVLDRHLEGTIGSVIERVEPVKKPDAPAVVPGDNPADDLPPADLPEMPLDDRSAAPAASEDAAGEPVPALPPE